MPKMKLADWARENGLSYITAHRHFHAGMIPNAHQLDSGTILVDVKDELSEQGMTNSSNDAMSLFVKKTVEFSKSGATVEDFAAFVISNFQLKLNGVSDSPRYSRQKPKAEDVQKHFQQFITKGEKPKTNSFVMEPEAFDEPLTNVDLTKTNVSQEELVKEFTQAVNLGSIVAPRNYAQDIFPGLTPTAAAAPVVTTAAMSTEGTVTRSVDLNTTPQPINYTGSNNLAFSSSLTSNGLANTASGTYFVAQDNSSVAGGMVGQSSSLSVAPEVYSGTWNTDFLNLPNDVKDASEVGEAAEENKPLRSKRGRKPSKR